MRSQDPEPDLQGVLELYERGQYVQALRLGTRSRALEDWPGTEGRILAGRLASNLGAERKSIIWHARSWRSDPAHTGAIVYHAYGVWRRLGPLAAWDFVEARAGAAAWSGDAEAELLGLRAQLLASFRDFERAEKELAEAERIQPGDAWLGFVRSNVLELADEYEGALAAAGRALEAVPWFRPAVNQRGELLQLLDRTDEAIEFLDEARRHLESPGVELQLALLLRERGRPAEAEEALDRGQQHAVLAEPDKLRWFTALRSNLAGMRGDDARSLELARLVETSFHKRVERVVARPPSASRKLLPVVFVRQHHMTCGPATLTALARWFGREAEHLEIAERICYGGTTGFSERKWAEERDYLVREFTLTAAGAVALLDRGFPIGVETREATSGHLQALIGYDDRREVLLVRDPYRPLVEEWPIAEFFERYRATGPRALLLVPRERAAEIEGLALEDVELHDGLYRVETALERHDHAAAEAEVRELQVRAPDHVVVFAARRALCAYEQDSLGLLAVATRLCELHPACDRYLIQRIGLLRQLGRKEERLALLQERVRQPRCDPALQLELARELSTDARSQAEARRQLHAALRTSLTPRALWLRSNMEWESGDRARATESARFAACLEATNEGLAWAYFSCCLGLGRAEEALGFLRARQQRFARSSGLPAQGLYSALERLARAQEGLQVLDLALEARPEDVGLALFAAEACARCGRIERARALLEGAARRAARHNVAEIEAGIEHRVGNLQRALACWREVLEQDPLHVQARSTCLQLVRATSGPTEQLAELRQVAASFPFHAPSQRMCIDILGEEHPDEAIELLHALLARHPDDAWAQRELALRLLDRRRIDEALEAADVGLAIEPRSASGHVVRGIVLAAAGLAQEAAHSQRKAVELEVDHEEGVRRYVRISSGLGQGLTALEVVRGELTRQATDGRGIQAWAESARGSLSPERILQELREQAARHEGVWLAQLVLLRELVARGLAQQALPLAEAATARFPLQARLWCVRAAVHAQLHDPVAARHAAEQASQLEPSSVEALHLLADGYVRDAARSPARELLERAAAGTPLDGAVHHKLVHTLLEWGEHAAALERAEICLRLLPRDESAWLLYDDAARGAGRPELCLERLRTAAAERPRDALPWLFMAQRLDALERAGERGSALRRALEIDPQNHEAVDLLAQQLVLDGKPEEAHAVLDAFRPTRDQQPWVAARRAWALGESGAKAGAAEHLEALVRENPQYLWARNHLTRYYRELEQKEKYYESAARMAELAPDDASALEQLGHAAQWLERKEEAERHFRAALELDPRRDFSAARLLELLIASGRHAEAREIFGRTQQHLAADDRFTLESQLACAEGNVALGLQLLRTACGSPAASPYVLVRITKHLDAAGAEREVSRELDELVRAPAALPALAAAWIERIARRQGWEPACKKVLELPRGSPAEVPALRELLALAGQAKESSVAPLLVRERRELLRKDTDCWGRIAAEYYRADAHIAVIRWCTRWERADAEPWMLLNLVLALWIEGSLTRAEEVTRRALELAPDRATPRLETLAACTALQRGDLQAARGHFERGQEESPADFERTVREMLDIALDALPGEDGDEVFRRARAKLSALRPEGLSLFASPNMIQRIFRICVRSVARRRGGWSARIWALGTCY